MKALKVLWREPEIDRGVRYSALPTPLAQEYRKDHRTTPSMGKLMVYLPSKMDAARMMCNTAATQFWRGYGSRDAPKGKMEIWEVDCHNLYRIKHIVWAGELGKWEGEELERFWKEVLKTDLERFDGGQFQSKLWGTINPCDGIWTTDWVTPRELLATLDVGSVRWIR